MQWWRRLLPLQQPWLLAAVSLFEICSEKKEHQLAFSFLPSCAAVQMAAPQPAEAEQAWW